MKPARDRFCKPVAQVPNELLLFLKAGTTGARRSRMRHAWQRRHYVILVLGFGRGTGGAASEKARLTNTSTKKFLCRNQPIFETG